MDARLPSPLIVLSRQDLAALVSFDEYVDAVADAFRMHAQSRAVLPPPDEDFNFRPDAIMAWIRSSGLDISCYVWSSGAACVTYDMTLVAVDGKCWEETTAEELLGNRALDPGRHAPRRLLVLGHNRPDTYLFRTGEGTLGMLRIVGLSQHGRGVKIRYKLINPTKPLSVAP